MTFIGMLRSHDVRVSPAETLDAVATVGLLGYTNRDRLRIGLTASLAKTAREQQIVETCFDRYFGQMEADFAGLANDDNAAGHTNDAPETGEKDTDTNLSAPMPRPDNDRELLEAAAEEHASVSELLQTPLMQGLMNNERGQLNAALRRAGSASGVADIQTFTQKGLYVRKILQAMGEEQLRNAVIELEREGHPTTANVRRYRDILREQVRDYVDGQYLLHAGGRNSQFMDDILARTRLSHIERHYMQRVQQLVEKMTRRLASRHSSRRRPVRRGQLDMRRTLRAGIATDGIMFRTHWRRRKPDKAQVMALCDVSGSVAAYAKFLLMFLYSLQDNLPRMRSFAFSNHLGEISELFQTHPVERAVELANWQYGGATDYGGSLRDFSRLALNDINRQTSVIILGDARNNRGRPELEIMQSLYQRSKQVIWLNPESRRAWGTGDSEMLRYLSACHVAAECSSLKQLERVVDQLLRSTR